jgi:glycosyltransferase involved in cell wall biosynthesis
VIKSLHLTNAYHSNSGGIRTFYRALLAGAERHQRYVRLVVPGERSWIEEIGTYARVYHLRAPRSPWVDRRYRLILPHRFMLGRSGTIWDILRYEQPDLIEICDKYSLCYLGGLVRRRWLSGRQRPALVGLTCERMDDNVETFLSGAPLARHFARWYMKSVYVPQFDGHIAVSAYAAGELESGRRAVHVAPMGLDAIEFTPARRNSAKRRQVFGEVAADPRVWLLFYAGRLSREKNIGLLVDTIEALQSSGSAVFHLAVAGDGPLREWLRQEGARRAPGRIHLFGHVEGRDALAALYANADAFLHPNPREPFGMAPLEAMASGLPLVAPCSGGVREYTTEENAWLAEPTPAAFADAVRRLAADPAARERKRARARQTAEAHDWPIVIARYYRLYDYSRERSRSIRPVTRPWPRLSTEPSA